MLVCDSPDGVEVHRGIIACKNFYPVSLLYLVGTDLFPVSTVVEDFTIYPSKALVYAKADYNGSHPYPIVEVSTTRALLDYLDQEIALQKAEGYVQEACNIASIQDIARSGSIKVFTRLSFPVELAVKKYKVLL